MEATDDHSSHGPDCARCGALMRFVRRLPKLAAHPELVSYRCDECGHVMTRPETKAP